MHGTLRSRLFNPPNAVPDPGIDIGGKAIAAARKRIVEQETEILRLSMHAPKITAPEPPLPAPIEPPKLDIGPEPRQPIKRIQYVCAKRYGLTIDMLISPSRKRALTRSRQIAMYLASVMTSASLSTLGRRFQRDHTTILHAVNKIARLIGTDASLATEIEDIKRELS